MRTQKKARAATAVSLLLVIVTAFHCCGAFAAEPQFVGILALAIRDEVARELKLSDTQQSELLAVIDAREDEVLELVLELRPLSLAERDAKLQPFRQESEKQGRTVFAPEQWAKLQQIRIRRMGLASLAEPAISQQLSLTSRQQADVIALLDRRERRLRQADESTVRGIRAEAERGLSVLLTAEQRDAWDRIAGGSAVVPPRPVTVIATATPPEPTPLPSDNLPVDATISVPDPKEVSLNDEGEPTDTQPDATELDATELDATELDATELDATELDATELDTTELDATELDATEIDVTELDATESIGDDPIATGGEPTSDGPVLLRFNFRYQPWQDVLEWFAEQADLSFIGATAPPGTFNYLDNRLYTPAESIDLLNSVLLMKGYTLIRRNRMLILINLEDGIPPNLVATVPLEQLDERGEFELISILFQLDACQPEDVQSEIQDLLGPQGAIVTLPKSRQILVTETAGRLRAIRSIIERIEQPNRRGGLRLETFEPQYATIDEVLVTVRQLLNIAEGQNATPDGMLRFTIGPFGTRLLINGTPEMLERFNEICQVVDVLGPDELGDEPRILEVPQLEIYSITSADPDSVLAVMQTLLADSLGARLSLDPRTNSLIALACPSDQATIDATLKQMQRDASLIEVIYLRRVDPQMAVLSVNKLFGIGAGEGKGPGGNPPIVDADPIAKQLFVRGTQSQIDQIRQLLEKMGEGGTSGAAASNVRMLPLTGQAAEAALERMQYLWPTMRRNPIRVVTPSGVGAALRDARDEMPLDLPLSSQWQGSSIRIPGPRMTAPSLLQPSLLQSGIPSANSPSREGNRESRRPRNSERGQGGEMRRPGSGRAPARSRSTLSRPTSPFVLVSYNAPLDQVTDEVPVAENTIAEEVVVFDPVAAGETTTQEVVVESPTPEDAPVSQSPNMSATGGLLLPPVIVAMGPAGLTIACEDVEALDDFESLLTAIAGETMDAGPDLTVFYLKYVKAAVAAEALDQIFGGGTIASTDSGGTGGGGGLLGDLAGAAFGRGGGIMGALLGGGGSSGSSGITPSGSISIIPYPWHNALIVQANAIDTQIVEQLLEVLDRMEGPEEVMADSKARLVPVFNTQASEIAAIIQQVFSDRMVGSGGGGRQQPSPEDLIRAFRGGNRGGNSRTNKADQTQKMSIGVDERSNSVIVVAAEPLFQGVKNLIEELDAAAAAANNQAMRVVTLRTASPEAVEAALSSMMGDNVVINRSGGSAARNATNRGRATQGAANDRLRALMRGGGGRQQQGGGRMGGGRAGGGRAGGGRAGGR